MKGTGALDTPNNESISSEHQTLETAPRASLWDWAQLVRIPNTFTVLADTTAGFLLVTGGLRPWERWVPMIFGVVMLYWSGMALNDLLDIERDRQERPHRPIASGRIRLSQAWGIVIALMLGGILFAGLSGQVAVEALPQSWLPLCIALATAVAICLYDGPLKRTPLAPVMMGLCRTGSMLLGASPVVDWSRYEMIFPKHVWIAAIGMGMFIGGITWAGRREARVEGDRSWGPLGGLIFVIAGLVVIGLIARLGEADRVWRLDEKIGYPVLIGLLGLTVIHRGVLAVRRPEPQYLQGFVRQGILLIIPLSAAMASLAAGPMIGLAIFSLIFPAMSLAAWFRVT